MSSRGYTNISNNLIEDKNLTVAEKFFIIALKSFDHKKVGSVYPTYETLMKILGTTKRNTVANIIRSLKEKEYISVSKVNRVNCYAFEKDYLLIDVKVTKTKQLHISNFMDIPNSNLKGPSNSNVRDTTYSNHEDTQINNKQNKKEKYIKIFEGWNKGTDFKEKTLSKNIENSIEVALKSFALDEILEAIDNYKEVYESKYYYDALWSLQGFLLKPKGISSFTKNGQVWHSYLAFKNKKTQTQTQTQTKIKASDYID